MKSFSVPIRVSFEYQHVEFKRIDWPKNNQDFFCSSCETFKFSVFTTHLVTNSFPCVRSGLNSHWFPMVGDVWGGSMKPCVLFFQDIYCLYFNMFVGSSPFLLLIIPFWLNAYMHIYMHTYTFFFSSLVWHFCFPSAIVVFGGIFPTIHTPHQNLMNKFRRRGSVQAKASGWLKLVGGSWSLFVLVRLEDHSMYVVFFYEKLRWIPVFNRKYIFIHGGFSISFWG